MRIAFAALALAACATAEPHASPPPPEDSCGATRLADLLGQPRSDPLVAEIRQRTAGRRVRWIRPGDAVTMDYSAGRLNVHLDARDRVERFSCG